MNIRAYCLQCGKTVTASSLLPEDEFWAALDKDADIEVIHIASRDGGHRWKKGGDHRWNLTEPQKGNLRRKRA